MVDKGASSPSSVIECDRVYYRAGEMTDLVNLWTTGPYLHCCGHLARLPCISLPQRHLRARSPLVPPRKAKRDAARGLAVAAAADIPGRPYGEQLCLPRLFVRGVRRRVRQLRVSCVLDTPRPYLYPIVLTQSHTLLCLAILQQTQPCPHRRSFLRADYAVDCSDTRVELLAWLGILLYPVGRPVG